MLRVKTGSAGHAMGQEGCGSTPARHMLRSKKFCLARAAGQPRVTGPGWMDAGWAWRSKPPGPGTSRQGPLCPAHDTGQRQLGRQVKAHKAQHMLHKTGSARHMLPIKAGWGPAHSMVSGGLGPAHIVDQACCGPRPHVTSQGRLDPVYVASQRRCAQLMLKVCRANCDESRRAPWDQHASRVKAGWARHMCQVKAGCAAVMHLKLLRRSIWVNTS